jgi:hypothetical protein
VTVLAWAFVALLSMSATARSPHQVDRPQSRVASSATGVVSLAAGGYAASRQASRRACFRSACSTSCRAGGLMPFLKMRVGTAS